MKRTASGSLSRLTGGRRPSSGSTEAMAPTSAASPCLMEHTELQAILEQMRLHDAKKDGRKSEEEMLSLLRLNKNKIRKNTLLQVLGDRLSTIAKKAGRSKTSLERLEKSKLITFLLGETFGGGAAATIADDDDEEEEEEEEPATGGAAVRGGGARVGGGGGSSGGSGEARARVGSRGGKGVGGEDAEAGGAGRAKSGSEAPARQRSVSTGGSRAPPLPLRVGTWNMKHLSDKTFGTTRARDEIAEMILMYDLLAIQEITSAKGTLRYICDELGEGRWGYHVSSKYNRLNGHKERECLAFIWKKDRLHCTSFKKGEPVGVYVHQDGPAMALNWFQRPPYVMAFRAGPLHLVCCTQHITCGGTADYPNEAARREEIQNLALVVRDLQDKWAGRGNPHALILIMGDFNLSPDDPAFADLKDLCGAFRTIEPSVQTMVSRNGNSYDNIWVATTELEKSASATSVVTPGSGRVHDLVEGVRESMGFSENKEAQKHIKSAYSDHFPVYIEVSEVDLGGDGEASEGIRLFNPVMRLRTGEGFHGKAYNLTA